MKLSFEEALLSLADPDLSVQEVAWSLVYAEVNPLLERDSRSWGKLSADESADVTAETWRRVWHAVKKGTVPVNPARFRAYVVTVGRNVVRDERRASPRLVSFDEPSFVRGRSLLEDDSSPAFPADALSDAEIRALRQAILARLSPPDAEIYELYVAGHSLNDITKLLGLTRNTLDARMTRLRKRLGKMAAAALLYRKLRPDDAE